MKYILVYSINNYPEMGGGLQFEEFENSVELDNRVEQIFIEEHQIVVAGKLEEYKYKAVQKVTKVIRD